MPHLFLIIGLLAVSTAPLLIRLAQPEEAMWIAAGRVLVAGLILGVLAIPSWASSAKTLRRYWKSLLIAGIALGSHFALWISSFSYVSTSTSVALVATQPIFAGILGYFWLGEGFVRREILGIFVACSGTVLLAMSSGSEPGASLGILLALAGAATVPIYLITGRSLGEKVSLLPYLAIVNLVAGAFLVVSGVGMGLPHPHAPNRHWWAILSLGMMPSLLGHTMLNLSVRSIPVHLVSLGILVEPVLATVSTYLVLGERPGSWSLLGGVVIVAGIFFGFAGKKKVHPSPSVSPS